MASASTSCNATSFRRALDLAPDYTDPPPNLELARQLASRRIFEAGHRHQQADEEVEAAACFERVLEFIPVWAEPRPRSDDGRVTARCTFGVGCGFGV
jgi:hypothetical protein